MMVGRKEQCSTKDNINKIVLQLFKFGNSTGLEKASFHSNPKERQCQRMIKLPHSFPHLTR